jgi:hypothetical protein
MGMTAKRQLGVAFRQNFLAPTSRVVLKHDGKSLMADG